MRSVTRLFVLVLVLLSSSVALADVVELKKGATVRRKADAKSTARGAVVKGARFEVLEKAKKGKGCKKEWLRIASAGWICGDLTRPSTEAAGGELLPKVAEGDLTPHEYAVGKDATIYPTLADAAGTNGVKQVGKLAYKVWSRHKKGGKRFVRIDKGYVSLDEVEIAKPSDFQGILLDVDTRYPLGWVALDPQDHLLDGKGKRHKGASPVTRRQVIPSLAAAVDLPGKKRGYLVAEGVYLDAKAIAVIDKTARPDGVGVDEHWLDVSIGSQTLVAYIGDAPVYATLVSTASNTPRGLQRIEAKRPHPTLKSTEKYSDASKYDYQVPWVMSLEGRYALHSAYWHDSFGDNAGNGCVNLTPRDAAYVWDFTEPAVGPGWAYANSVDEDGARGTPVLIRD